MDLLELDLLEPDLLEPDLLELDLLGPDLLGPDLLELDLLGPDLLGPDLLGPDLLGPDLLGPDLLELAVMYSYQMNHLHKIRDRKPIPLEVEYFSWLRPPQPITRFLMLLLFDRVPALTLYFVAETVCRPGDEHINRLHECIARILNSHLTCVAYPLNIMWQQENEIYMSSVPRHK